MPTTYEEIIEHVLNHEGGFTDDPDDPGNWTGGKKGVGELKGTNYGIAANTYGHLDIKNLTREEAIAIYKADYWDKCKAAMLPWQLRYIHLDTAINMGPGRAAKLLQEASGAKVDGIIGPMTLEAAQNCTLNKYAKARMKFYFKIVSKNPTSAKFLRGWTNRVIDIIT